MQVDVAGRRVVLNRQLPFDVRPEWGAVIAEWKQPIREVGIEGLSIIFKDQRYNGGWCTAALAWTLLNVSIDLVAGELARPWMFKQSDW